MNKKTVNLVTHYRQFVTESHKLANSLSIPDKDAKHEIMVELTQHRLSGWSDADICTAIFNNDIVISYKMTYARREILRRHYKQLHNQQQATHELAATVQDSYVIDMSSSTRTQQDIDLAITLLPQIFANAKTCAWVESVLRVGAEETMEHFSQTPRAFTQKLNRVCKYAEQHRERTIGLMASRNDSNDMHQLEALTQWENLLANEDVTNKQLQRYITQHSRLVNDIVDTPKIKKQGKLVADWANADHADQYAFCNIMAERKAKLERYLTLR